MNVFFTEKIEGVINANDTLLERKGKVWKTLSERIKFQIILEEIQKKHQKVLFL